MSLLGRLLTVRDAIVALALPLTIIHRPRELGIFGHTKFDTNAENLDNRTLLRSDPTLGPRRAVDPEHPSSQPTWRDGD